MKMGTFNYEKSRYGFVRPSSYKDDDIESAISEIRKCASIIKDKAEELKKLQADLQKELAEFDAKTNYKNLNGDENGYDAIDETHTELVYKIDILQDKIDYIDELVGGIEEGA